jgi:4-oxalmesaconate hydratase
MASSGPSPLEPTFPQALEIATQWLALWENGELSDEVLADRVAELVASRSNPSFPPKLTDDAVRVAGQTIIDLMVRVGTDIQFLSPRPYMQMHSVKPARVTALWTQHMNDLVFRTVTMFPTRFRAIAGLPQYRDTSPVNCFDELEFRVKEQGFIGCLLNPDPTEGDTLPPPGLGEEFWYPLYDKLCELDIPALIHSAGSCQPRESYTLKFINEESIAIHSLMNSPVFKKFPKLKLIVPHGGGAIPHHMGRFRAWTVRNGGEYFDDQLKRLHFDTTTYDKHALELLFKVVGPDRVLSDAAGGARRVLHGVVANKRVLRVWSGRERRGRWRTRRRSGGGSGVIL